MANEIVWAANTAAVAPLDSDDISLALLPNATGFDWKEIDSTRAASFDPAQHIVIPGKANGIDVPLTAGAWYRRLPSDQPQLRDFGAKGDGDSYSGTSELGGMTASGTVLTIDYPRFKLEDVGSAITVAGAGFEGATLASTIAVYISETEVELAHSALTTVTNKRASWRGASITSGQPTLVVHSPLFTPGDVGKVIIVAGATTEEVVEDEETVTYTISLVTTIAGYTSGTTVTLADSASVTVAGAQIYWGTDDTAAIQAAIDFMGYYPLRSRALDLPRGMFMFRRLEISGDVLGISLNGVSYWDATLMCFEHSDVPAIWNKSQEFKMFDMTLMSAFPSEMNRRKGKAGLKNDKDYLPETRPVADVDCVINQCRISGFSRGIYHKGRSLVMRGFNHIATCDWGIEFEWPDEADYEPGTGVMNDNLGFRGNIIEGLRCHSMSSGAILNDGPNAHKMRGLKLDNIILDIGRCIFRGHLGIGGMLTNSASLMTPTTAVVLTGGSNFTVANINVVGIDPYTPPNLIRLEPGAYAGTTTGEYRAGTLSNVQLSMSEQTAVIVAADTTLIGVKFDDFTFDNPGFSMPASYSAFQFNSTNSTVEVNRPLVVAENSRRSFIHNTQASNVIHLNVASRAGGNATPLVSGTSSSIIIDHHYQYTPVLTNTQNVTASAASVWDYVFLAGDLIQVSGRCTAQPAAAGNCVMQIALPVPSNFSGSGQASGSFIAGTTGSNIAGVADSNGSTNKFEVRWVAPDNTNRSFAFLATYRVI